MIGWHVGLLVDYCWLVILFSLYCIVVNSGGILAFGFAVTITWINLDYFGLT